MLSAPNHTHTHVYQKAWIVNNITSLRLYIFNLHCPQPISFLRCPHHLHSSKELYWYSKKHHFEGERSGPGAETEGSSIALQPVEQQNRMGARNIFKTLNHGDYQHRDIPLAWGLKQSVKMSEIAFWELVAWLQPHRARREGDTPNWGHHTQRAGNMVNTFNIIILLLLTLSFFWAFSSFALTLADICWIGWSRRAELYCHKISCIMVGSDISSRSHSMNYKSTQ